MNLKKLTTRFFITLSIATLSAIGISCEDTETTNTIGFAVYYYGVTDIGPSMSYTVILQRMSEVRHQNST